MGEVPPSHDAVRAYLDSAVADAAERWVGRAADATAYADLVAAVLARREALSPTLHLPERFNAEPLPVQPRSRHNERRGRPRWPLSGGGLIGPPADRTHPAEGAQMVEVAPIGLPSRPPGRHRTPPQVAEAPHAIDLSHNLSTVLDWLGQPDS
jgi:hypothetical protein